ncbi:hypothetical protein B0A48_18573 [Cryoendolithus antarcticus]|uniref:6-methylsalicylate decarboxylase n=1 Tax=Cryoendolithus antarcticus TaxID=1507870 RepID=A0A1V8S820_9PEZI|nr:hypothetical protein B0A48_18573 [Cryoendolithus antarcticus]
MVLKIDVHTHALPGFFKKILSELGPAESGVPQISWSMDATRRSMAELDIGTSILSLSAPGPEIAPNRDGARSLARQFNEWAAKETKADPSGIGFFAAVPGLQDTDGCLTEIRYAFDELKADGVCFFTTYQGVYLGDPSFEPIWKELNVRAAVVFIHPTMPLGFKLTSTMIQPPTFDFPRETGRTAAHMVITGMKRRYPDVKVILSHGEVHCLYY